MLANKNILSISNNSTKENENQEKSQHWSTFKVSRMYPEISFKTSISLPLKSSSFATINLSIHDF